MKNWQLRNGSRHKQRNKKHKQKPRVCGDLRGVRTLGNEKGSNRGAEGSVGGKSWACPAFLSLPSSLAHLRLFPQTRILYTSDLPATFPGHHCPSQLHHQTGIRLSDEIWGTGIKEMRKGHTVRCRINLSTSSKFSKCQ